MGFPALQFHSNRYCYCKGLLQQVPVTSHGSTIQTSFRQTGQTQAPKQTRATQIRQGGLAMKLLAVRSEAQLALQLPPIHTS
jgi:hypothetical protein